MSNALDKKMDGILDDAFDKKLNELILAYEAKKQSEGIELSNADRVGPDARHKLKGILKHYAKDPHPFAACVRDNRKRFGPKTEGVCAVLKDIIRGTTKWRGKNNPNDKGTPGLATAMSEMPDHLLLDDATYRLVGMLGEMDLWDLMGLAEIADEGEESLTLAYPMQELPPPPIDGEHAKFLADVQAQHSKLLSSATKYINSKDAHPQVAGHAADIVSESARAITRMNRILKTGSPYG